MSGEKWVSDRVFKSCNDAIIGLRKLFEKVRKFWTNEQKSGKNYTYYRFFLQDKSFLVSYDVIFFLCMFMPKIDSF